MLLISAPHKQIMPIPHNFFSGLQYQKIYLFVMKKVLLSLLAAAMLSACSQPSAEEQLIASYEQTIGDSKVDLNLEVLSIEKVGEVTAADSLKEYKEYLDFKTKEKLESFERVKSLYEPKEWETAVNRYKTDYAGTFLEPVYKKVQHWDSLGNQKIGDLYQATYKINNPLLNGAEQELTKQYLIAPDKSEILARLNLEKE
jgi:hypothetical protein